MPKTTPHLPTNTNSVQTDPDLDRRNFLQSASLVGLSTLLPSWALAASEGNQGHHHMQHAAMAHGKGKTFDLTVDRFKFDIGGKVARAIGVNGTVPAPLIRFHEGEEVTLNVHNKLDVDTSIHWHGLLVPFEMDGVPGVTYPGIKPHESFTYKFSVPQSGTYWYHSHSGLQEQVGHFGPIIIDPKDQDPISYDREYVLMLSDWTFENPHRIYDKLKKNAESLNYQQRTAADFEQDVARNGLAATLKNRTMWGDMRMSPRDLSDVGGTTYTYLINGRSTQDNWNGVFTPGERVRLRIINASGMTIFNVRIPGLPMTIVQADGLNVQPLEIDEFQMGVAETYDVIIEPTQARPFAFVAEAIDRSGQVVATLAPRPGMKAAEPALRPIPLLTMRDMGMDHGSMDHDAAAHEAAPEASEMDHSGMNHGNMSGGGMHHAMAGHHGMKPDPHGPAVQEAKIERGPGVVNIATTPASRLDEPGIGLEDMPHRVLRYSQLRALDRNPDPRPHEREVIVHLTSNMERYMWSFDGIKFSEVAKPITFYEGERVRLTMINDTMMPHPIHLHGMFFDLVNGGGDHSPRKHTVIVKPGEKLSVDISADHIGDWAFHCHLIFHMHAGMMQVVSVLPRDRAPQKHQGHKPGMMRNRDTDTNEMGHDAHMHHHKMGDM